MNHYKKIEKAYLNDAGHEIKRQPIKYLVFHYTAGRNDTAEAVARYFKNINKDKSRYASAHYVVDDKSCWQCVEDRFTAWHCGGNKYKYSSGGSMYGVVTNYNSIGIEMCNLLNNIDTKCLENGIALGKKLIEKYGFSDKTIVRHYDVTGKHCPAIMIDDQEKYKNNWKLFKKALLTGKDTVIKIEADGTLYKKKRGTGYKWVKLGKFQA